MARIVRTVTRTVTIRIPTRNAVIVRRKPVVVRITRR